MKKLFPHLNVTECDTSTNSLLGHTVNWVWLETRPKEKNTTTIQNCITNKCQQTNTDVILVNLDA